MAERLFGTDGVRGRAGTYRRSTCGPSAAWAARWFARCRAGLGEHRPARRPRHARVGRVDRARAGSRGVLGGRTGHQRRHHLDARRGLPDARGGLRRRRRHLRLAQPVRGQRHQGVLGRRREVHRALEARDRGASWPTRRGTCRTATRRRWPTRTSRPRTSPTRAPALPSAWRSAGITRRRRLRQRRDHRPGAAPASRAGLRRRGDRVRARRPQHQPGLRLDASRVARAHGRGARVPARAWRSTATATARSSSTSLGGRRRRRRGHAAGARHLQADRPAARQRRSSPPS